MEVLEVDRIRKYYATQKAVDDVSFSIAPGSIFGLLGPNGAGKTTLIRMLTGIFYPDEGEILLKGKKFDPHTGLGAIGYMPEERGLYKKMRIGEQAVYFARLKGLTKKDATARAKQWFQKLEMENWWYKKVEDLSKGMGQKLQFVITVLHQPSLIILDEPFSGLDPVNANLIKEEIRQLAASGASIIFSTHRMEQVEELCDHIILLNEGKKILDGTIRNIQQQFKEDLYALSFREQPAALAPGTAFEIVSPGALRTVVKIKEGFGPNDVLRHFLQQELTITGFYEILPSMNDIFIQLVEGTPLSRQFQQTTRPHE